MGKESIEKRADENEKQVFPTEAKKLKKGDRILHPKRKKILVVEAVTHSSLNFISTCTIITEGGGLSFNVPAETIFQKLDG